MAGLQGMQQLRRLSRGRLLHGSETQNIHINGTFVDQVDPGQAVVVVVEKQIGPLYTAAQVYSTDEAPASASRPRSA